MESEITTNGKITYIPIYDVMFLGADGLSLTLIADWLGQKE